MIHDTSKNSSNIDQRCNVSALSRYHVINDLNVWNHPWNAQVSGSQQRTFNSLHVMPSKWFFLICCHLTWTFEKHHLWTPWIDQIRLHRPIVRRICDEGEFFGFQSTLYSANPNILVSNRPESSRNYRNYISWSQDNSICCLSFTWSHRFAVIN